MSAVLKKYYPFLAEFLAFKDSHTKKYYVYLPNMPGIGGVGDDPTVLIYAPTGTLNEGQELNSCSILDVYRCELST